MISWLFIVTFVLSLVLIFFFAGMEMAYFSANRLHIEIRKRRGGFTSGIVGKFIENPTGFVGTTIIGFTFFLTFFTMHINYVMTPFWNYVGIHSKVVHIVVEIFLTTIIVILLGGFLPRLLFRANANKLLHNLAVPADFWYQIFSPIAEAFVAISRWMLKYIFNVKVDNHKQPLSRSDLKNIFKQNRDNFKSAHTRQLLENAEEFSKVKIKHCLVPRKEIVGMPLHAAIAEVKEKFIDTKLSKIVIYEKNIDRVVGYVHQLDLFKKPADLKEILLKIPVVPESMGAADLLTLLNAERKSIAWVVDEFGGTAGIITINNVLQKLFGQIQDEYETIKYIEETISETEFIFSGRVSLSYLEEKYGFDFNNNNAETLSGYIVSDYESIPNVDERIIIDDYEFEITEVSDTRIEKVKMKLLKPLQ